MKDPKTPPKPSILTRLFSKIQGRNNQFGILDLLCLGAAGLSFFWAASGAKKFLSESETRPIIATLESGAAQRLSPQASEFDNLPLNGRALNLDMIWIDKGSSAQFKLFDGKIFNASERTLFLLKRRFQGSKGDPNEVIRVIVGKIDFPQEKTILESDNQFKELPSDEKHADPNQGSQVSFPLPGHWIYVWPDKPAKVVFKFNKNISGTLVVRDKETQAAQFLPFDNAPGIAFSIPALNETTPTPSEKLFSWQIIDKEKRLIAGTAQFSLRPLSDQVSKMLLEGKITTDPKQPIEVLWDRE